MIMSVFVRLQAHNTVRKPTTSIIYNIVLSVQNI